MRRPVDAHVRAFLRDPKGISAPCPTSAPVVERIARKVQTNGSHLIIEYGPGSGVLTRRLLERLPPEGKLVAIELDAELAERLRAELDDPRLVVLHDAAQSVGEISARLALPPADCVVSGIPFFWFSPETAIETVANTHRVLAEGGRFVTYQTVYQRRRHLRAHLERCFSSVQSEVDLRNLPPYRICVAIK